MIRISQNISPQINNTLSATLKSWLPILQVNLSDIFGNLNINRPTNGIVCLIMA